MTAYAAVAPVLAGVFIVAQAASPSSIRPSPSPQTTSTPRAAASLVAPPTPVPPPVTAPTATPAFGFVYKQRPSVETTPFPGPNPPQIAEIDLSDATLVTPGTIRVRVLTSDPVVAVVAETFGNTIAIPEQKPGLFAFEGYVGVVPAYVKNRTYDVTFTASTRDGRTATVTLPLTLR